MLRHVIWPYPRRWPTVDIIVRGKSDYARPEAMAWSERQRVGYIFGLFGNRELLRQVGRLAEGTTLARLAGEAVTRTKITLASVFPYMASFSDLAGR